MATSTEMSKQHGAEVLAAFHSVVDHLYATWRTHHELFDETHMKHEARSRLLADRAPASFGCIKWSLIATVILELWKLVDSGQKCLTLNSVKNAALSAGVLTKDVERAFGTAVSFIEEASVQRPRHAVIAHNGMKAALTLIMPPIDLEAVEKAVAAVRELSTRLSDVESGNSEVVGESCRRRFLEIDAQIAAEIGGFLDSTSRSRVVS